MKPKLIRPVYIGALVFCLGVIAPSRECANANIKSKISVRCERQQAACAMTSEGDEQELNSFSLFSPIHFSI